MKSKLFKSILIFQIIFILSLNFAFAQKIQNKQKNWDINGYVKDLQNVWVKNFNGSWTTWNTIHNRINFKWFPSDNFSAFVGLRNNFQYGRLIQLQSAINQDFKDILGKDNGYLDLTKIIASDTSYCFVTNIDRAYFDYNINNLQIRIGRQRINWGLGLVWNPNDIFNTFSYFDFDYEERPGSDAVKIEYFTGMASSVQAVCKINNNKEITLAGMYRFNKWNYDMQILGGIINKDITIGCGWAGQIGGAGFRGEATYFNPKKINSDSAKVFIASIDFDYTFKNNLYIHTAYLFNSNGKRKNAGMGTDFLNYNITAKTISRAKNSLFGQVSYALTPLMNLGISSIFNTNDLSAFMGPSCDFSLTDNISVFIISQIFTGKKNTEYGNYGKLFFLRLKLNF